MFVRIYKKDILKGIVGWHVVAELDFDMDTKQLSEKGKREIKKILELVPPFSGQVKTTIYAPVRWSGYGYELYEKDTTVWQLKIAEV